MTPKQVSVAFEEEKPPKRKTTNNMQSEEEWTPQAASPASEEEASESRARTQAATKPKRTVRGRKPRTAKEAKATETDQPEPAKDSNGGDANATAASPAGNDRTDTRTKAKEPDAEAAPLPQSDSAEPPRASRESEEKGGRDRGREGFKPRSGGKKNYDPQKGGNKKKKKKKHRAGEGGGGPAQPSGGQPPSGVLPDPNRLRNLEELEQEAASIAEGEPVRLHELYNLTLHDLTARAKELGVVLDSAPNRRVLISRVMEKALEERRPIIDRGSIELNAKGYGFIVRHAFNYRLQQEDSYLAESFVRRYGLKKGHVIEAQVRPPENNERCPAVLKVNQVMERDPMEIADITPFEDLVPYYPLERVLLEVNGDEEAAAEKRDVSMRAVDLLTPIGLGQRGLIVAPPRTGKTILLQQIANSVAANKPEANLMVLLIDERPEEVTDFRRNVRGEVVSSTFDEPADSHVQVAEMVIEKARRLVEAGEDVVILLDSITRLARAYNTMMPSSGKILSGGVEANALQKPKRFFGAARNIEGGGSLTILATALIDTGSRMDEVIFEEFKGTGNMELHLDRALVDKRVFPALNIEKSGTRKEELLYHPDEMARIYSLRRAIQGVPMVEAMEMLVQRLKKTRSNVEFLMAMNR